jgi:TatD DNase family protein
LDRLDLSDFDCSLEQVVANAKDAQVERMLCVSVTLAQFTSMAEKTQAFDNVYLSCGTHPLNQHDETVEIEQLMTLATNERVVAIGETGLDYYYAPETKELQLDSFVKHISAARKLKKPLIIHTRDARQDTIDLLKSERAADVGGVLHCFTESWEMAKAALDLGFYISFSGIVTFKNASDLREVAKKVPADRILIETDAPYLAPVPYRGKQNQPAYVAEVAKLVSELRGTELDKFAHQTTDNFDRLFLS